MADLNFAGANTAYATHALHSFSAKFPPQLVRWGLETFTRPYEVVLDPMVGSGTTLVEARLLSRHAWGLDIDPLARLIAQVKSTPLDPLALDRESQRLLAQFRADLDRLAPARQRGGGLSDLGLGIALPEFPNRDYWFLPEVSEELALLKHRLGQVGAPDLRRFFYLVFSAMIITKSTTSVANVRDLAHSRPHFRRPERRPDVFATFQNRLGRLTRGIVEFSARGDPATRAAVIGDDARSVPLADQSVDLVFTSPPYVNAIDYPRAHKFSLFWLADVVGLTPAEYRALGKDYIGTDRVAIAECAERLATPIGAPTADEAIRRVAERSVKRAGVMHRYFSDMRQVLGEIARVLKAGRTAVIVVCPSRIGQVAVATHAAFVELARQIRTPDGYTLQPEEILERTLDDRKRQLPIVRGVFGPAMRTEYVVILRKLRA